MSTLVRDHFKREMTDEMKMSTGLGLKKGNAWKPAFHQEKTDKRREEYGEYVHPSVSILTEEAGNFKREEIKHGFKSDVLPLTYTLEYKVSHEFMSDLRRREVARNSFKMGTAFTRRRYKNACQILTRGFSTVTAPNGRSLFNSQHTLSQSSKTDSNVLNAPLTTEAFDQAMAMLFTQLDENGDIYDCDLETVRLIVPPQGAEKALQIAGSSHVPENMNNAINVYSGSYGRYKVDVMILPFLFSEADEDWAATQWYMQDPLEHMLYFFEREEIDTWMIDDPTSLCALYQGFERSAFAVWGWRGMLGSKGNG